MITTYGFSIAASRLTKEMRQATIDAVLRWLDDVHPPDKRSNTTPINIRCSSNDPIFRVDVLEQDAQQAAARGTTATLIVSKLELYFDLRRTLRPTQPALLPRRTIDRPEPRLNELVVEITKIFKVRDAGELINQEITIAGDQLSGQSLAAFAEAPGRRLPIVVEVTTSKPSTITSRTTARQLTGIAHLRHITTRAAEEAFNSWYGRPLISASWITVFWPRGAEPENFHQHDDEQLVTQLIAASIGSLPTLKLTPPPKPRQALADTPATKPSGPVPPAALETKLQHDFDELERVNQELLEENAGLLENATRTDMLSAQNAEERDKAIDDFVTLLLSSRANQTIVEKMKDPKYLAKVSDAVEMAKSQLDNLIFHERAMRSSNEAELLNGRRVLQDLYTLNNLAEDLKRGKIKPHQFLNSCSEGIVNFASSISETAIQEYPQDYTIDWKGENVMAKPHIRCGDARIHFYHDMKTNEIVIAYVGRHLRDKSTN
ncbi:MAG: hypothetical protein HQ486_07770 [Acidimicrobiaceae bacterium]|nr:hypothetical protein [Acidimicrobiaceae bacterium]